LKRSNLLKIMTFTTVALSGVVLAGQQPTAVQADGVGTVVNPAGDAPVYIYDAPNGNVISGRTLPNGSSWQIGAVQTVSGSGTWYEIGSNVWINDYAFKATGASGSTTTPTTPTTPTTTPQAGGVGTIVNPQGDAPVYAYNGPAGSVIAGQTYPNGSRWQYGQVQTVSGQGTFYEIGPNIWVNDYVFKVDGNSGTGTITTPGQGSTTTPSQNKIATTTEKTPVFDAPSGELTGQLLGENTQWVYTSTQSANGATWLEVGTNQWINASQTNVTTGGSSTGDSSTGSEQNASGHVTISATGANLRDAPNGNIIRWLDAGTSWQVTGAKTVNGSLWYQLGGNQWVSSSTIAYDDSTNVSVSQGSDHQILHLTVTAQLYSAPAPAGGGLIGQSLQPNTDWKVNDLKTYDGQAWALVGSNQWVSVANGQLIDA
jgi:hypothetical protein